MTIQGLHHITIISADARRTTDFYTRTLGLRLVKRTVNFDDPGSYHLYFGDELGRPGSAITFFEWPGVRRGQPGIGGTHHYALQVDDDSGLLKWKRRLSDLGVAVEGPLDRRDFRAIAFRDPDGTLVEIAARGPGRAGQGETWPEPVPEITPDMALARGMHHITAISSDIERTHAFFGGLLGMRRIPAAEDAGAHGAARWSWGAGDGRPGALLTYVEHDPARARRAQLGAGQTHHFALAVADEVAQLAWRERLLAAGLRVSPVLDRVYFKSIYTSDPDGHIVELATLGPGFTADEAPARLGQGLMLPPWLEAQRPQIERALRPIGAPASG